MAIIEPVLTFEYDRDINLKKLIRATERLRLYYILEGSENDGYTLYIFDRPVQAQRFIEVIEPEPIEA